MPLRGAIYCFNRSQFDLLYSKIYLSNFILETVSIMWKCKTQNGKANGKLVCFVIIFNYFKSWFLDGTRITYMYRIFYRGSRLRSWIFVNGLGIVCLNLRDMMLKTVYYCVILDYLRAYRVYQFQRVPSQRIRRHYKLVYGMGRNVETVLGLSGGQSKWDRILVRDLKAAWISLKILHLGYHLQKNQNGIIWVCITILSNIGSKNKSSVSKKT